MQVAAQELLHVVIGNDATNSNPIAQDLRGFFEAHTLDSCCDPSRDCPCSILTWLQFADTHSLHICSTSTGSTSTAGSASAAAAAWDMVARSLRAYRAEDKAAVLIVLARLQDLQPDFVEAVLVILAGMRLPDSVPAYPASTADALAQVSILAYDYYDGLYVAGGVEPGRITQQHRYAAVLSSSPSCSFRTCPAFPVHALCPVGHPPGCACATCAVAD